MSLDAFVLSPCCAAVWPSHPESHNKSTRRPPAGCDLRHASRKGEGAGVFFCCWFPHWDSLRSPTHGDKGKASGPTTPSLRSFNKFLISKLAVMPIHLFPHFLELVG